MSLIVLYLVTRYDVFECNSLRDMTIISFFYYLWPSPVTFIVCQGHCHFNQQMDVMLLYIGTHNEVCMFNRIWDNYGQLFGENLNDVTMTPSLFRFLWYSNTNLPRTYLSDILIINFMTIRYRRAAIQSREVNRKLWRKNGYYVTVTLTFDPRLPISIGFEPVR